MTFRETSVAPYSKSDFLNSVFMSEGDYDTLTSLLYRKKNLVLQGAPGTGKTFAAQRLAYSLMGAKDDANIMRVQFHQGSAYEDYIVGYRPTPDGGFAPVPGKFTSFFREAAKPDRKFEQFYLIIDEINRANLSKVFGELLMLIEADHRDEFLDVPGLDEPLCVPNNVFIIGMMNTADRSLALVDYALRRRFAFFTMHPALKNPAFLERIESYGNDKLISLVDAVGVINTRISEDPALGPGYCIGHSYFCFNKVPDDSDIEALVKYELVPLLEEYWFDPSDLDQLNICVDELESSVR